jgi:hypothetical protein
LNSFFDGQLFSSGDDSSEELDALDQALEGSGLEEASSVASNEFSLLDLIDGDISAQSLEMQGWLGGIKRRLEKILRKRAAKIIRKILRLVRKYSKLKVCVPIVIKAIAAFKAKKYTSAIKYAYQAYRCIKKRL